MQHQATSSVRMNVSAEKVWAVLDDYVGLDKYSNGVETTTIIGDKATGLGAKRHCVFYNKDSVVEEITEYEENKVFTVELSELSAPLKSMVASFRIEKRSETSCEVFMTMDFSVRFGPLGIVLGILMMRPVLKGVQKNLLTGIAYHAFTGKNVGSELPSKDELAPALTA